MGVGCIGPYPNPPTYVRPSPLYIHLIYFIRSSPILFLNWRFLRLPLIVLCFRKSKLKPQWTHMSASGAAQLLRSSGRWRCCGRALSTTFGWFNTGCHKASSRSKATRGTSSSAWDSRCVLLLHFRGGAENGSLFFGSMCFGLGWVPVGILRESACVIMDLMPSLVSHFCLTP